MFFDPGSSQDKTAPLKSLSLSRFSRNSYDALDLASRFDHPRTYLDGALLLVMLGVRLERRSSHERSTVQGIVKAQYRITIGQTQEGSHQALHGPRNKLELLKASLLTLLVLSSVIGVFLAAFVLGSIIASVLLILIAISAIAFVVRRLILRFRRGQPIRAPDWTAFWSHRGDRYRHRQPRSR